WVHRLRFLSQEYLHQKYPPSIWLMTANCYHERQQGHFCLLLNQLQYGLPNKAWSGLKCLLNFRLLINGRYQGLGSGGQKYWQSLEAGGHHKNGARYALGLPRE